jgi:hypothetical protein
MINNRVLRKFLGVTREELTESWNKLLYAGLHGLHETVYRDTAIKVTNKMHYID